jgi:hypothetical protein
MLLSSFLTNTSAFLLPILISLNIILFIKFYDKQKYILKTKGFFGSLAGIFFGIFGVGCAACSALLLAPLISIFGLTTIFKILPYGGEELGVIGLVLIIISSIYLLKKISDPLICR